MNTLQQAWTYIQLLNKQLNPYAQLAATRQELCATTAEKEALRVELEKEKAARLEAETRGCTDPLTGLLDRREFYKQFSSTLATTSRLDSPERTYGLLFIDLDHFKSINDTYGHDMGDKVLCAAADQLRAVFSRTEDIIARIGGEEIIVGILCSKDNGEQTELGLADEARLAIEKNCKIWSDGYIGAENNSGASIVRTVTASIGVANGVAVKHTQSDIEGIRNEADAAMYQAKENGRNRVYYLDKEGSVLPSPLNPIDTPNVLKSGISSPYRAPIHAIKRSMDRFRTRTQKHHRP